MSDRVNLLFPVEIIDREFDFRLLLAGMCAGPSNRVLIAQHDLLHQHVESLRGGVYLGKNVFRTLFPTDLGRYHALHDRGVALVHLDEEGLMPDGEDRALWRQSLSRRLDPACLQRGDRVCAWGAWQRDFYRASAPDVAEDIVATGHPRFDLCKPAYRDYMADEVSRLRRRFGRFVLVNTSFGAGNSAFGHQEAFAERNGYRTEFSVRDRQFKRWLHEKHLVNHFVGLIYRLSIELGNTQLVVRPHPCEDRALYDIAFRDSANVHVEREGGVTPWLLACEAMVHERCTTGIEAALAGTPIVTYTPVPDERRAMYVPNLFGVKTRTEDEAVAATLEALAGSRRPFDAAEVPALAHDLLANFGQDSIASVAAIVRDAQTAQRGRPGAFDEGALKRLVHRQRVIDAAKRPVRPLFAEKARKYAVDRTLYYGFSRPAVARKLAAVQRLTGTRLRHAVYGDSAIVIETVD